MTHIFSDLDFETGITFYSCSTIGFKHVSHDEMLTLVRDYLNNNPQHKLITIMSSTVYHVKRA